ncbi:hypothetical protein [Wolbachia pipientis]|nr:hypothetical protein [Wolbachia pipientis]
MKSGKTLDNIIAEELYYFAFKYGKVANKAEYESHYKVSLDIEASLSDTTEALRKELIKNYKFFFENENLYKLYSQYVTLAEHYIIIEECKILASLFNIIIYLYMQNGEELVIRDTYKPDESILGTYRKRYDYNNQEVRIKHNGTNHFEHVEYQDNQR